MSSPLSTSAERYRHRWIHFWGLATVAGLGLAMLVWSPATVVLGLALDTACVAGTWALVRACLCMSQPGMSHPGMSQPGSRRGPHLVQRSLAGVTALVALAAVSSVSAAAALLVLLAAALSSRGLQDLCRISRSREDDHDLPMVADTSEPGFRWPADGSPFHA